MKKLLIPALLLAAATSYGALLPAGLTTATGGRATDYANWFGPQFNVASDINYTGVPNPSKPVPTPTPASMTNGDRIWSGWSKNWSPGLSPVITGTTSPKLDVEIAFLGETAGWWDDIGYRYNGVDYLLADGVQAVGGLNRVFGDYAYFTLNEGDTLDFFVTGSQIHKQDGDITVGSPQGGKYYVFDKSLNTPWGATNQSYFGQITPLTSVRGASFLGDETGTIPFTVVAFEDINIPSGKSDKDYNDLIFAFRAGNFIPDAPVPEPSTYGLIGAAALLGLAGYRRFKKA